MAGERLRVLQLGSPTGLYGAERWILALVRYLDREKIEPIVSVIKDSPDLDAPLLKEAERLGIETHCFHAPGRVNFKAVDMVSSYIKERGIHILHTHAYKQDIIGLLAARRAGCKVISTPHGWSKKADFKLWCYEMLNRVLFPLFDAVAPLSEELHRPLSRIPGMSSRLHLIKNGVDIGEIDEVTEVSPEVSRVREKGAFVIGYIGQLIPRKGIDILLEAVSRLDAIDWHVFLIGTGVLEAELRNMSRRLNIHQRVSFMGFRNDRLNFLLGLDCFVLPSRLEGIPRCLMEAGAMGKAIVASDIPGCKDIVKHEETGLLFKSEDPYALAEALVKLSKDGALRERLGASARRFVVEHYSAQRMAREYESLYFRLC